MDRWDAEAGWLIKHSDEHSDTLLLHIANAKYTLHIYATAVYRGVAYDLTPYIAK